MTKDELKKLVAESGIEQPGQVFLACDMAEQAMSGKKRRSGEPADSHAFAVGGYLLQVGGGWIEVSAGVLHDVDEDSNIGVHEIQKLFGDEVAFLVEAVSCDKEFTPLEWVEQATLYYAKLFRCALHDARAIALKLADRVHYFRTCRVMPTESRQRKASETADILLPMTAVIRPNLNGLSHQLDSWLAELRVQSERYYGRQVNQFAGFFSNPQLRRLGRSNEGVSR